MPPFSPMCGNKWSEHGIAKEQCFLFAFPQKRGVCILRRLSSGLRHSVALVLRSVDRQAVDRSAAVDFSRCFPPFSVRKPEKELLRQICRGELCSPCGLFSGGQSSPLQQRVSQGSESLLCGPVHTRFFRNPTAP